jgi:hypothetical protein
MTYFYTCDKCGASIKIETDDKRYAETKIKAWEKHHSQCRPNKAEKLIVGHPDTKKGHIKK